MNLRADVPATSAWHGVGDIVSLVHQWMPYDVGTKTISNCSSKWQLETKTGVEAVATCVRDAADLTIREKEKVTTGSQAVFLATAKKALLALDVSEYVAEWMLAWSAVDARPQTLRNYDQVQPPTDRGGHHYIARDPSSGRAVWVVDKDKYAIPDGGDFLCLARSRVVWDIGGLEVLDTSPRSWPASGCTTVPLPLWDYRPTAEGGNTGTDVILRNPAGKAWLVNTSGQLQAIPDVGTYLCLASAYPVIWNVPDSSIAAWSKAGSANCRPGNPPNAIPEMGLTLARQSGRAGFYTGASLDRGKALCPTPPSGQLSWLVAGGVSNPLWAQPGADRRTSLDVGTSEWTPPGKSRVSFSCTQGTGNDPRELTEVRQLYADLEVTGPAVRMEIGVSTLAPGQLVEVRDGGGCGPGDWSSGQVQVRVWDGGNGQTSISTPVQAGGRWGPVRLAAPATAPPAGLPYQVDADCSVGTGWDSFGMDYPDTLIAAAAAA